VARRITTVIAGLLLIALGWLAAGSAQTAQPDFEIIIIAPSGETTVECVRGCNLAYIGRGVNPNDTPISNFRFACSGERCKASVGGWVSPPK
jgi:hypothetical protein